MTCHLPNTTEPTWADSPDRPPKALWVHGYHTPLPPRMKGAQGRGRPLQGSPATEYNTHTWKVSRSSRTMTPTVWGSSCTSSPHSCWPPTSTPDAVSEQSCRSRGSTFSYGKQESVKQGPSSSSAWVSSWHIPRCFPSPHLPHAW